MDEQEHADEPAEGRPRCPLPRPETVGIRADETRLLLEKRYGDRRPVAVVAGRLPARSCARREESWQRRSPTASSSGSSPLCWCSSPVSACTRTRVTRRRGRPPTRLGLARPRRPFGCGRGHEQHPLVRAPDRAADPPLPHAKPAPQRRRRSQARLAARAPEGGTSPRGTCCSFLLAVVASLTLAAVVSASVEVSTWFWLAVGAAGRARTLPRSGSVSRSKLPARDRRTGGADPGRGRHRRRFPRGECLHADLDRLAG